MSERPPRAPRAEPREIVELRQLKTAAARSWRPPSTCRSRSSRSSAACRRACRCPGSSPTRRGSPRSRRPDGPAVRFGDIPLEWTDLRLTLRQTADMLQRYEALERAEHEQIVALDARRRPARSRSSRSGISRRRASTRTDPPNARRPDRRPASIRSCCSSLRPFLARCAEALAQRVDFSQWRHGHCPFCGWEPDFAVITPGADRRLICGRCLGQWAFAPLTCPFCANDDRSLITSFATRDGRYRVYGCDVCRRYLKAYDGRNAARPVLVAVDTIATLPLDAAAMQRGYVS